MPRLRLLLLCLLLAACATPTAAPTSTALTPTAPPAVTVTRVASAVPPSATATSPSTSATPTVPTLTPAASATPSPTSPAASATAPAPTATLPPPSATVPPPASATPSVTPAEPTPAARILTFGASPERINPGDPVTLAWSVQGSAAELCALPPLGGPQPPACLTVPISGTAVLVSADRSRYWARYSLRAIDDARPADQLPYAELAVAVNCPDLWLTAGPPAGAGEWNCPAGPARTTSGAAQHFEQGGMYWLAEPDEVLVSWLWGPQAHTRDLPPGQPDTDPTLVPPDGLYQPVRGFGLVWRGLTPVGEVRKSLGWGTEPEREYTFRYQCNAAPDLAAAVCLVLGPDGYTTWAGLDWGQWLWP